MPGRHSSVSPRFFPIARQISALFGALSLLTLASSANTQDRSERFIAPGAKLLQWVRPDGPHALYAVEADGENTFLRFGISHGKGETLGLEPLSQHAERVTQPDRYPVAAVNGDFFMFPSTSQPGIPINAAVVDGEVFRSPYPRSCLILREDGTPEITMLRSKARVTLPDGQERELTSINHPRSANAVVLYTPRFGASTRTSINGVEVFLEPTDFPLRHGVVQTAKVLAVQQGAGNAPINPGKWVLSGAGPLATPLRSLKPGDEIQVRIDFDPALKPGDQVMGGGPRIVRNGRVSVEPEGGNTNGSFSTTRHPRSAIGFNGKKMYLVVVDGRQPGYSVGMSLTELAEVMVGLGCTDAYNVDGGGSSALWVRGTLVNKPSDGRERPVANGLWVFSTAPKGEPERIVSLQPEITVLAGAEAELSVMGEDRYYNPVPVPADRLQWEVDAALGTVRDGKFVASPTAGMNGGPVSGFIRVAAGNAAGMLPVRVYPRPARLELLPAMVRVAPGAPFRFRLKAFDDRGRELRLPANVAWQAAPEVGAVDANGRLTATATPGRGTVAVMVNGVQATADVEVTPDALRPLDDFEGDTAWRVRVTPLSVLGSVRADEGKAKSGKRALRIDYDFSGAKGTRAVYAVTDRDLGHPFALKMWVYGDGQRAWLRARVRDAQGALHTLDLARHIDWQDEWKELRVQVPQSLPGPLRLESIYVVELAGSGNLRGTLFIDDLNVEY